MIGAIFGWIVGNRTTTIARGAGWGVLYGIAWWVLGGQVLMPLALHMPPFASVMMAPMRMVAVGSLVGHIIYGVVLGALLPVLATQRAGRPLPSWIGFQ